MQNLKIKNPAVLPEGYQELMKIDLQKNKKQALIVNGIAAVLMVLLAVIGHLIVPIGELFSMEQGLGAYFLRFGAIMVLMVVYMVLHELVHGIFMKTFSGVEPKYGFTGLYAYAGSSAYFSRPFYIIIALAPIVVWGIVLAIVCPLMPREWFWVAYFIQIANISGAGGDLYVSWLMMHLPSDILVNDVGVAMTVYSKQANHD